MYDSRQVAAHFIQYANSNRDWSYSCAKLSLYCKVCNSLQSLLCTSIQKKINLLKLNKEAFSSILKCENTTLCLRFQWPF